MMIKQIKILCATVLLFASTPVFAEITLAVNSPRGELVALKKWGALVKYLTDKTGQTVTLVPLTVAEISSSFESGTYDFYLTNPVQSVIGSELHGNSLLATLQKKNGAEFAGLIITTPDSGITTAADLKGKHVLCLKIGSAAGAWMFQSYHLFEKGLDPSADVTLEEVGSQTDLALTVLAGFADAGYVRTGLLESMVAKGDINLDDFVIVDRVDDPVLGLPRTTRTYPEWYFSARKGVDPSLQADVQAALLALQPTDAAAVNGKITGFSKAVDPGHLLVAMKTLKVGPFK